MFELQSNYGNPLILIEKIFPILHEPFIRQHVDYTNEEVHKVANLTKTLEITGVIQDLIIIKIENLLRNEIIPKFWSNFTAEENVKPFHKFLKAVDDLFEEYCMLNTMLEPLEILRRINNCCTPIKGETNLQNILRLLIRSTMFSLHDASYESVISCFYEEALLLEDNNLSSNQCPICAEENCINCGNLFLNTNRKLIEMGLLGPLTDQALTDLIYCYINMHIQKTCKDNFDTSYIGTFENWLENIVINWLQKIYGSSRISSSSISNYDKRLKNYLYNTYAKIRIDQLFNIIIEYPESLPALEDIRMCLPKTDLKPYLTKKLQKAMETRLLHLGVSTSDVLTAYVAAIRSLRVLDPSGLLLEIVTQPIHQYLRSREDTVRCVVSSLTEEGPNDLAEELVRGEAVQCDETATIEEDDENWESWIPDPVDHYPSRQLPTKRSSDIISMLVNVYGSKELFVNEYRTLLADRLLSQYFYDTEKEIRYLELLKLRFGDSQLHYCEVMLKDIVDSKRINQHIKQDSNYQNDEIPISTMIVSAQFWPPFKEEKLELHPKLVNQMQSFTAGFETLKGSRTLCWKNHLGIVDLEIEVADRKLSLSVSPIHATIMMHFQDTNKWALDELSKLMQVPPTILRRKIIFWQSHGLLVEIQDDVFLLKEEQFENNVVQEDIIIEDYESESAMASAQDQREEELQTFWSYIVGMLMNLDSLSLERIHQMLKMFAFQGPAVEYNIHELKIFLDRKVREHQLIHSNGLYKLPK